MNDTVTNSENVTISAKHGDDITVIASPRPWRIPAVGLVPTEIWSADGTVVARGVSSSNAVLIVNAVNIYDEVAMQNTDSNGGRQYASPAQARREERYRKELAKEARELREERDRLRDIVNAGNNGPMLNILKADLEDAYKDIDRLRGERDRLRDIVRRIKDEMERCHKRDGEMSQVLIDTIYEAHDVIGEESGE